MGKSSAGEIFSPDRSDTRGQHGEGLVRAGSFRAGLDSQGIPGIVFAPVDIEQHGSTAGVIFKFRQGKGQGAVRCQYRFPG